MPATPMPPTLLSPHIHKPIHKVLCRLVRLLHLPYCLICTVCLPTSLITTSSTLFNEAPSTPPSPPCPHSLRGLPCVRLSSLQWRLASRQRVLDSRSGRVWPCSAAVPGRCWSQQWVVSLAGGQWVVPLAGAQRVVPLAGGQWVAAVLGMKTRIVGFVFIGRPC